MEKVDLHKTLICITPVDNEIHSRHNPLNNTQILKLRVGEGIVQLLTFAKWNAVRAKSKRNFDPSTPAFHAEENTHFRTIVILLIGTRQ